MVKGDEQEERSGNVFVRAWRGYEAGLGALGELPQRALGGARHAMES